MIGDVFGCGVAVRVTSHSRVTVQYLGVSIYSSRNDQGSRSFESGDGRQVQA